MNKVKKIGIIGRISEQLCDGQTVKTRILVRELQRCYPDCQIMIAESSDFKSKPHSVITQLARCVRECDVIFVLLSRNGMRLLFPILHLVNCIWKKPLLHDCIGGSLDEVIRLYPSIKRYLNKFDVNWVETRQLKTKLDMLGIQNVEVLPNFKPLMLTKADELKMASTSSFRFCTFSRVNEAKGIGRAVQAIIDINREAGKQCVELDIFGPIEDNFEAKLYPLLNASNGAAQYKGVVAYQDSVSVLKNYDMLLFPTTFYGEGFPGTLIDAFSAGLPVIATDWHCNSEIITEGITGFLYSVEEEYQLKQLMEYAMQNPEKIFEMRKNCLQDVRKYSANRVMTIVCDKINQVTGGDQ